MSTGPFHIHIVGICGVATSAIAIALKDQGYKVTGSDKGFFPPVSTDLEKNGVYFYAGWHPENIGEPNVIIAGGSGTSLSNPEIIYAKEKGIEVLSFAEAIGRYIVKDTSIVVTGTWGKTTISSLLSFILLDNNMKPSYFTGGVSLSHKSGSLSDSNISVVEGDEYKTAIWDNKPKFYYYKPSHLILTAVSWDHADLYPTEKSYFDVFKNLINSIPKNGVIVANKDNSGVKKILDKAVFYGRENADYIYKDIIQTENGLEFKIKHKDNTYNIKSQLLGSFQAENITGAFAMAHNIGLSPEKIISSIEKFKGMKRRLEKRYDGDIKVIDDIAHSGEKAISVLNCLRSIYKGKIIMVFEPNIGGREIDASGSYKNAFIDSDIVIIPRLSKLKINENEDKKPMDGKELAGVISNTHKNTLYIEDDEELINFLLSNTKKGDTIAFLGSHGFRGMIEETVKRLGK
jgi:UDP-N-acetylmuramate: L-alanyl-gamma-D-glutamyl-meso-diaminopimelate ligase